MGRVIETADEAGNVPRTAVISAGLCLLPANRAAASNPTDVLRD